MRHPPRVQHASITDHRLSGRPGPTVLNVPPRPTASIQMDQAAMSRASEYWTLRCRSPGNRIARGNRPVAAAAMRTGQ